MVQDLPQTWMREVVRISLSGLSKSVIIVVAAVAAVVVDVVAAVAVVAVRSAGQVPAAPDGLRVGVLLLHPLGCRR